MREEEVIFIFKREKDGFRFSIIETCPSKDVPFAIGISKTVPILSDKRISDSELEIEFSDSLENALSTVNDVFGLNYCKEDIEQVESVCCGRRLLYHNQSTIFSVDFDESITV